MQEAKGKFWRKPFLLR